MKVKKERKVSLILHLTRELPKKLMVVPMLFTLNMNAVRKRVAKLERSFQKRSIRERCDVVN